MRPLLTSFFFCSDTIFIKCACADADSADLQSHSSRNAGYKLAETTVASKCANKRISSAILFSTRSKTNAALATGVSIFLYLYK